MGAGKAVFDVQPMRLSEILTPLRNELSPVAAARGIELRIAEQDQQEIFQEFKRVDASSIDTGLGLGLVFVERACKGLDHPFDLPDAFLLDYRLGSGINGVELFGELNKIWACDC